MSLCLQTREYPFRLALSAAVALEVEVPSSKGLNDIIGGWINARFTPCACEPRSHMD
jgi:hypothetical protein